jgi:hypothetical protein
MTPWERALNSATRAEYSELETWLQVVKAFVKYKADPKAIPYHVGGSNYSAYEAVAKIFGKKFPDEVEALKEQMVSTRTGK